MGYEDIHSRLTKIEFLLTSLVAQRTVKEWYSTSEMAALLGKAEFTVREWCRLGRVHAKKKLCGRGLTSEWIVSHTELTRIRNEGLLASHFGTGTLGKSLCESATWLDCEEVNDRFRKLLADPFQVGGQFFYLFPKQNQQPADQVWRYEPMSVVWQLRHTAVHNVGVITQSDGVKLRLLAREPVEAPRLLAPTRDDLRFLKRFLDETATACNERVCDRLAILLSTLLIATPGLFAAQDLANRLAASFRRPPTVAGVVGVVPPD